MNIALLSTGFLGKKEATAITVFDFAKNLVEQGEKVTIISEKRNEALRFELVDGIMIYRIGFPKQPRIFSTFSFYNRIFAHAMAIRKLNHKNKESFNIIHNFSAAPILSLRVILSKIFNRKAKTIHTLKSYSREGLGKYFFKLLNLVDAITVPTKIYSDFLITKGVKKEKVKIINSHINTKKFFPKDRSMIKNLYGYSNRKVILYYGSMWENKGTNLLIQTIPYIIKNNPNILFLFLPRNTEYAKKYESSLNKYCSNIKIIYESTRIEDYVALADLVVLPYTTLVGTEGNPSCLLESMACKTPVVTSNLPELKEIVNDSVLMAEPGDLNDLVAQIEIALKNYPNQLIEKAYLESQKFTVDKISKEFVNLYKTVLTS
jgi:glycosyltransferase involved in cell wall biosynthesis